jgi:Uma2 family endonuclease
VLPRGTEEYHRTEKLEWYRQYGVRESWLVDLYGLEVTVVDYTGPQSRHHVARSLDVIRSTVLPDLRLSAFSVFV